MSQRRTIRVALLVAAGFLPHAAVAGSVGAAGDHPSPSSVEAGGQPEGWGAWASKKAYAVGLGAAKAADTAWGAAYQGTTTASPYVEKAWSWTRDAGSEAWDRSREVRENAWSAAIGGRDALGPYAGEAWDLTRRLGAASYDLGAEGVRAGAAYMPEAREWALDFAASGATAFVSVGGATFVCGALMTPLAAVSAGAGYMACLPVTFAGGMAGQYLLDGAYERMGRMPRKYAFAMGAVVGGIGGAELGRLGVGAVSRMALRARYGDFRAFSRAARGLTERNLKAWGPEVAAKRGAGYHVDHVLSVKCAWVQGTGVAAVAALSNLQYLTARQNLSLGAKGC